MFGALPIAFKLIDVTPEVAEFHSIVFLITSIRSETNTLKQMKKLYTLLAVSAFVAPTAFGATELVPGEPLEIGVSQDLNIDEATAVITGYFVAPTKGPGSWDSNWNYVYPDLTEDIDRIDVLRSCSAIGETDVVVYRGEGITPGARIEFTDENPFQFGYSYTYKCVGYQLDEEGNIKKTGSSKSSYLYIGEKPGRPDGSISADIDNLSSLHFTISANSLNFNNEEQKAPIKKLSLCEYIRFGETPEIYAVENPVIGENYEFDMEFEQGKSYKFQVFAISDFGTSDPLSLEKYVGLDAPGKVSNITVEEAQDGMKISWNAPTSGKNNGVFDPSTVLYKVYRHTGSAWAGTNTEIASGISELSFVDTFEGLTGPINCSYAVSAYNDFGNGDIVLNETNYVVGPDCKLPFKETFYNDPSMYSASMDQLWTKSGYLDSSVKLYSYLGYTGVNGTYYSGYDPDKNTNEGFCAISPNRYGDAEYEGVITSPGIDFSEAEYPVLSFYTMGYYGNPLELTIDLLLASEEEGYEIFSVVPGDDVAEEQNQPEDYKWVKRFVTLEDVAGESAKVIFRAKQHAGDCDNSNIANIEIDEILIDDYKSVKTISVEPKEDGTTLISWEAPVNVSFGEPDAYRVFINDEEPVLVKRPEVETPEEEVAVLSEETEVGEETETPSAWLPSHSFAHEADKDYAVKVQAIYGDIEALHSEEVAFKGGATVGVELVGIDTVKSVEYYDVNGLRVEEPVKGQVIIKRVEGANGAVRMQKVVF